MSGFQTLEIQNECRNRFGTGSKPVSALILYQTSGWKRFQTFPTGLPVPNQFRHWFCIRRPVGNDWNRTSDNRTQEVESTGRPKTGRLCPVFR